MQAGITGTSPEGIVHTIPSVVKSPGSLPGSSIRKHKHGHHHGRWYRIRRYFRKIADVFSGKKRHNKEANKVSGGGTASPETVFERLQQGLPVTEKKQHHKRGNRFRALLNRINPFRRKRKTIHHHRRRTAAIYPAPSHSHKRRRFWHFSKRKMMKAHRAPGEADIKKTTATARLLRVWNELPSYLLKLAVSTGLFMAAYIITWFTYSLAVIFIASFFNIHAVLTYYEVMWTISNTSPQWNDLNIVAITFAGPLASLVMGLVYYFILKKKKHMGIQARTLVFWLFVLSMAHFLGAFVAGAITWQGFGYVIAWVYMHIFFRILISLIFLATMAWIGWLHAGNMLETRTLRFRASDTPYLLINRMVLPYVLGTILLCVIKLPNAAPQHPTIWDYDVMILASALFAVIPPLFNKKLTPPSRVPKKTTHLRRRMFAYGAIAASVALILLYRAGLSDGLYIFMKFVVNVTRYR